MKKLIIKYLTDSLSTKERDTLIEWLTLEENKEVFFRIVKENYDLNMAMQKRTVDVAYLNLISSIDKNEGKVVKLFPNWMKYAAVFILLVTTGYFLTVDRFTAEKVVVIDNTIEVGTNKATLTKADGANVILEKGKVYEDENTKSDGSIIDYSKTENLAVAKEVIYNYLTVPRGGEFEIRLEDGTYVWLNAESKLKYPIEFVDGESRQVELVYGEAYFDVSSSENHNGDIFEVLVENQVIDVLGTEFNVKAYSDESTIETTLVEGKVQLNIEEFHEDLIPGEQLVFDRTTNSISKDIVNLERIISWKNGYFLFEDKSLIDAIHLMERWYDVDIEILDESLKDIKLSGSVSKNQNIEYILITLKNLKNINYEITKEKIYLK